MTATCAGCGKQQDGALFGTFAAPVFLGYGCGCAAAFAASGLDYTKAAQWARERRRSAA
jgi:hypothetical protein